MSPKIHSEDVPDYRNPLSRLLNRIHHRHYVVRRTWTLDDSSWRMDPNNREYCECGVSRHGWNDWNWKNTQ